MYAGFGAPGTVSAGTQAHRLGHAPGQVVLPGALYPAATAPLTGAAPLGSTIVTIDPATDNGFRYNAPCGSGS